MRNNFIVHPFLPDTHVSVCAVSEDADEVIRQLEKREIEVIKIKKAKNLQWQVSSHPDMQILPLGGKSVAVNKEQNDAIQTLEEYGFHVITVDELAPDYPFDCSLDVVPLNHFLFLNEKSKIDDGSIYTDRENIHVNQGYCKCSTILINEECVITDDAGLGKTYSSFVKNVIVLEQNEVELHGYDRGFVGGSCGKLGKDVLAFSGRIPDSSFGRKLINCLKSFNIEIVELSNNILTDIGGIVPLMQKSI